LTPPRERACLQLTAIALGAAAAKVRPGLARRVPIVSNAAATSLSRAAAAKSIRSPGLKRRPLE
jgi:hypothetical protein